jgi:hypothetical protein
MNPRKHRWGVISPALVIALAACSPAGLTEQIIESQEGVGDVEIDEDEGTVKIEIEDEEGDASVVFGGGEVPEGFPIPIADGGTVLQVVEVQSNSSVSLNYEVADYDRVKAFYEEWIDSTGAEQVNKFESSEPRSIMWTLQDGDNSYSVQVVEAGDLIVVNLLVEG